MSKRNIVKNPCRICNQTVANKSGVQCKGACARWAHYKCLGYSHQKILDIRGGVIKITCPCPNCSPKVPVEVVTRGKTIREFFPGRLRDAPCPPDGPCQSPTKQSPGQLPGQSPGHPPAKHPSPILPPCPGPPPRITPSSKPIPQIEKNACAVAGKISPCILEVPRKPTQNSIPACQLPPRKQYLSQPYIRKQTDCQNMHGKPPCLKPGELKASCQSVEETSKFPRQSPKRSLIKSKDEFAFNPTSLEPQLFHPDAFKSKPMPPPEKLISRTPSPICQPIVEKGMSPPSPCNLDTCKPLCLSPPLEVPASDKLKSRTPSPIYPASVVVRPPMEEKGIGPPGEPVIKNDKDDETPPLSRTPSDISLLSPNVSPKPSKEVRPISNKTTSVPASPQKSPSVQASPQKPPSVPASPQKSPSTSASSQKSSSTSASPQKSPSGSPRTSPHTSKTVTLPDTGLLSKLPFQPNKLISPVTSLTKDPITCPASTMTSLSHEILISCKMCKCSYNESLSKSNCISSICPKRALAKTPPKAPSPSVISVPPPSLKSALPSSGVTSSENKPCMDCTSSTCPQNNNCTRMPPPKTHAPYSGKKPCVDCTSSICSNRYPRLRSAQTSTDKKSRSCGCLTVLREPEIRTAISDSKMTNTGQSMLFSAIDRLCTTVGQLSGQLKQLMSRMRVNS